MPVLPSGILRRNKYPGSAIRPGNRTALNAAVIRKGEERLANKWARFPFYSGGVFFRRMRSITGSITTTDYRNSTVGKKGGGQRLVIPAVAPGPFRYLLAGSWSGLGFSGMATQYIVPVKHYMHSDSCIPIQRLTIIQHFATQGGP